MILTGPEIEAAVHDGRLRIAPFISDQVNPNSYNVRLGPTLITYTSEVLDAHRPNPTRETTIGPDGHVLQPDELYLGHRISTAPTPRRSAKASSANNSIGHPEKPSSTPTGPPSSWATSPNTSPASPWTNWPPPAPGTPWA